MKANVYVVLVMQMTLVFVENLESLVTLTTQDIAERGHNYDVV